MVTNINDVIEYVTNNDLSDLVNFKDEDKIDVMINQQTTSKQHYTACFEDEENMSLAAYTASKPDVATSSEDEDEMPVALLQSTNDPTSRTSSKKTHIQMEKTRSSTSFSYIFWQSIGLIR